MRITTFIGFLGTLLLLLTACGRSSSVPAANEALPLAEDMPTFLFFFTDN